MRASRLAAGILVGAAVAAFGFAVVRRRASAEPRADLYFEDGSSLSLDREAPEADRLFALARTLAGSVA